MAQLNSKRRHFLKQCSLLTASGMASSLTSLGMLSLTGTATAMTTRPSEYRAMVCVYLTGGNDLNMLVPLDDYDNYQVLRGGLAIDRDELINITQGSGADTKHYGLHPNMASAKTLFDEGKLSVVVNTGSLFEPTTAEEYRLKSVRLPPELFSHNSQKEFVRTLLPYQGEERTGWAGRIADLFAESDDSGIPLNLSMGGTSIWQRGNATLPYVLRGSSIDSLRYYDNRFGAQGDQRAQALRQINELPQSNVYVREYGRIIQESIDLSDQLRSGVQQGEIDLTTSFPTTVTGQLFRNVANVINARAAMQMPQQVFYINIGGWDHHDNLLAAHGNGLRHLSDALLAFDRALGEMGLRDQVVTFTNHDFGRTVVPNGDGSDHAWGGHQIIMGGSGGDTGIVKGGTVIGRYPEFVADDPQYIDFRGVLVPEIPTEQIAASIAKWFGDFSDAQLDDIFPNLPNFNNRVLDLIRSA